MCGWTNQVSVEEGMAGVIMGAVNATPPLPTIDTNPGNGNGRS